MGPRRVVLDASATIPALVPEPLSASARNVFASESHLVQLVAPEFWLIECGNALWKKVRRKVLTVAEAGHALDRLEALSVTRIAQLELHAPACMTAFACDITTYDALYVATTQYVDGTLVTADEKLLGSLRRAAWPVRAVHVSDWSLVS